MLSATEKSSLVRPLLFNLLNDDYKQEWYVSNLRYDFLRYSYVKLPNLFKTEAYDVLKREVIDLGAKAKERDFTMPGYETPRKMNTIGGSRLIEESSYLWTLYINHSLRNLLEGIAGARIYSCLHPNEFMVANYLFKSGSTHGWHLDDPAYALIIIFDAPPIQDGGNVEIIPDWFEFCEGQNVAPETRIDEAIEIARSRNLIRAKHHEPGDSYFLRADKTLHRVTPIEGEKSRRIAINLGFENTANPHYGETANLLYNE